VNSTQKVNDVSGKKVSLEFAKYSPCAVLNFLLFILTGRFLYSCSVNVFSFASRPSAYIKSLERGTGIRELTRGSMILHKVHPGVFGGQRQGWKTPRGHCFCVCSGSVLLGDLLGVRRSIEC